MEPTYARSPAVEAAPLEAECILFHPEANRFFVLNDTAAFIWSRLETAATASEIAAELRRSFEGVGEDTARKDVATALEHMLELAVVETSTEREATV
jgi:RPA family protein